MMLHQDHDHIVGISMRLFDIIREEVLD